MSSLAPIWYHLPKQMHSICCGIHLQGKTKMLPALCMKQRHQNSPDGGYCSPSLQATADASCCATASRTQPHHGPDPNPGHKGSSSWLHKPPSAVPNTKRGHRPAVLVRCRTGCSHCMAWAGRRCINSLCCRFSRSALLLPALNNSLLKMR